MNYKNKQVGSISGQVFFWSTLGSIVGSLSSGFFLIPFFGISQIMGGVSIILFVLGLIPLLVLGFLQKKPTHFLMLLIVLVVVSFFQFGLEHQDAFFLHNNTKVVYQKDGVYEKITLYEDTYKDRPVRFLMQDKSSSAAMFLDAINPADLVYNYTKYYALYKIVNPDIKNVFVIGGGAYSIPKAIHYEKPDAFIDVAEIEPQLPELARQYFTLPETAQINTYQEDGRQFLRSSDKKYDLIFSDVYNTIYSIPFQFTTKEFLELAKDKMSDSGIFVANIIGDLSRQDDSFVLSEMKTFQEAFGNSYFFTVSDPYLAKGQNIIFLGIKGDKKINFDDPIVKNNTEDIIRKLKNNIIDVNRFELSSYPVLEDNFAPVEYMMGQFLERNSNQNNTIDGKEILSVVAQQLRYGPRYLTAPGHKATQDFLISEAGGLSDEVKIQKWNKIGSDGNIYELKNIIARINPTASLRILIGTHYDSTKRASRDKNNSNQLVSGANNSASGTAVLIELLRNLKNSNAIRSDIGLDFVFFDGEEGIEMQGGDSLHWSPLGSTYFADHVKELYPNKKPEEGIIIDMVCNKDLQILKESSSLESAKNQVEDFWKVAQKINPAVFLNKIGPAIQDDQTPLNKAGIPSFLLIDFNYPYLYTTQDTLDKCSSKSLEIIANVLKNYIINITNE